MNEMDALVNACDGKDDRIDELEEEKAQIARAAIEEFSGLDQTIKDLTATNVDLVAALDVGCEDNRVQTERIAELEDALLDITCITVFGAQEGRIHKAQKIARRALK